MAMFILGVLVVAGEYRQRTILQTFLAEPRRGRVVFAKLITTGALGALAARGGLRSHCGGRGPAVRGQGRAPPAGRCHLAWARDGAQRRLLRPSRVAIGALTRNTVAAIIAGLIWIQLVEVGILENAVPSIANGSRSARPKA